MTLKPFTFIHIPKTGGETITLLLETRKKHVKAKYENFDGYVFAFVRNPYSRLYSWYSHLRKPLYKKEISLEGLNGKTIDKPGFSNFYFFKGGFQNLGPPEGTESRLALSNDFNNWVKQLIEKESFLRNRTQTWLESGPLESCYDFTCDLDGKCLVPNIYFFENYKEELSKLFKNIDREDLIPQIEVVNSSRKPTKEEISEETKEIIYEYFKKDFETFGYPKEWKIKE